MSKNTRTKPVAPFKAKLKHYHRKASPELYSRKQKRWEDVATSQLGDAALSGSQKGVDLKIKVAPAKKDQGE